MTDLSDPDFLHGIELFHGLTDGQRAAIRSIGIRQSHAAGDVILTQGAPGESLFVVLDGQVEVSTRDATGSTRTRLYLGPGQVVGEYALLDGGQRSATILADQDGTVLYQIDREPFLALCEQDTRLGYVVMRNLARDLAFKARHRHAEGEEE